MPGRVPSTRAGGRAGAVLGSWHGGRDGGTALAEMCAGSRQDAREASQRAPLHPPPAGYVILVAPSGRALTHELGLRTRAGDAAMWIPEDANGRALAFEDVRAAVQFRSAAVGGRPRLLWARACHPGESAEATTLDVHLSADGGQSMLSETGSTRTTAEAVGHVPRGRAGAAAVFSPEVGPLRLPSVHLNELRERGFTKLRTVSMVQVASMKTTLHQRMESLISQREAAGVEISGPGRVQEFNLGEEEDAFQLVEKSPMFARLHANPVMLHLLEAFTGGPVRAAHPPSTRITMPQNGELGPGGGW